MTNFICLFDQCMNDPRVLVEAVRNEAIPILRDQLRRHPVPSDVHLEEFDVLDRACRACDDLGLYPRDLNQHSYAVVRLWYIVFSCVFIQDDHASIYTWFQSRDIAMIPIIRNALQSYLEGHPPYNSITELVDHVLKKRMLL